LKVLTKGIMPDGTHVQIEDWSEDYSFCSYGSTIAGYPKSKMSHEGAFSPKGNETYRFSFSFESETETRTAFDGLLAGTKALADFKAKINNPKHADCI
jgi:hypothetical protein